MVCSDSFTLCKFIHDPLMFSGLSAKLLRKLKNVQNDLGCVCFLCSKEQSEEARCMVRSDCGVLFKNDRADKMLPGFSASLFLKSGKLQTCCGARERV
jgi:hypothetical protein